MYKWFVAFLFILLVLAGSIACESSEGASECSPECIEGMVCRDGACVPDNTVDGDDDEYGPPIDGDIIEQPTDGDRQEEAPDGDQVDGDGVVIDGDQDHDPVTDGDGEMEEIEPDDWDPDFPLSNCDNNPELQVPEIKLSANQVDFGAVAIGDFKEKILDVCNAGGVDLNLTSVQFSSETSPTFLKRVDDLPVNIPAGKSVPIYLRYYPNDSEADTGKLIIYSDDPNSSVEEVVLISAIKATPELIASPEVLQYLGTVASGEKQQKATRLTNIGLAPTSVLSLLPQLGETSPYKVLSVTKNDEGVSTGPWVLDRDEFLDVTVELTMGDEALDDMLAVTWLKEDLETVLNVELTTSDLEMCAKPDAGPDQTVRPLDTVYLDGSLSHDINGVITEYKWEWKAKPAGSDRALIKNLQGDTIQGLWTDESKPNFYAELAGAYEIGLTVRDTDEGCSEVNEDKVLISVVPDETVHIQLIWSDPGNDFDLHFIKPDGYHSRDCGKQDNDTDCCWSNCDTDMGRETPCPARGCPGPEDAPNWSDTASREDDPTLDIDDRNGRGPENINLSLPQQGDYLVTVENYNGSESAMVKARVYLFGSLKATFQYGPPYTASGIPKHYHWNICYIRVHSATNIEVVPIDNSIEFSPDPSN